MASHPADRIAVPPGPRFTTLVAGLPASVPFVGPETQERSRGAAFRARLGANESAFGPSPAALRAMAEAAAGAWRYGDPENHDLKAAIAARHGVGQDQVVVGEGIDGLLGLLVRLLVEPGTSVVTSDGAYPTFVFHAAGYGARLTRVPYRDDREDLEALLAAARRTDAALVYFSNPDNPMGTRWTAAEIEALLDRLPAGTVLCIDEAYAEFAPEGTLPALDPDDARLVRMRTFSKAHGMAGARIAYAIAAPPLARAFDKVRNHFGVNRIAQAGALAALEDAAHVADVVRRTAAAKDEIARIAHDNGLAPLASATNFVAIDCGRDGDFARRTLAALVRRGVFVRMPAVSPLDRCIRVTAGPPEALAVFAEALPEALAEADAPR